MPLWEKRKSFLILGGLAAFHLVLISIQVPVGSDRKLFEKAVFFVFSPVQKAAVSGFRGLQTAWKDYFDLRGVRKENQGLKRELFFLAQEKRFLEDRLLLYQSEAEVKANLAAFRDSLIAARVVGVDAANYFRSVMLDKGARSGVQLDMAVCDRAGNLVGRTIRPVSLEEATVQLITDQDSSVSVSIGGSDVVGILSGSRQAGYCTLKYILTTSQAAKENDELVTTGYDKIYPPGLRVGRIVSVKPTSDVFKSIVVRPSFSYATLDTVAILPRVPGGKG